MATMRKVNHSEAGKFFKIIHIIEKDEMLVQEDDEDEISAEIRSQ
jgi:hypothetical protein